jgi:hypothetical protein
MFPVLRTRFALSPHTEPMSAAVEQYLATLTKHIDRAPSPTVDSNQVQALFDALLCSTLAYAEDPESELRKHVGWGNTTSIRVVSSHTPWKGAASDGKGQPQLAAEEQPYVIAADSKREHYYFGFRGTANQADAVCDIKVVSIVPQLHGFGHIHPGTLHSLERSITLTNSVVGCAGFLSRAHQAPINLINSLLSQGKKVTLTGHSLGGACAMIVGHLVLQQSAEVATVHTDNLNCISFGAPFVGDYEFVKGMHVHASRFASVIMDGDIVPLSLPLFYVTANSLMNSTSYWESVWDVVAPTAVSSLVPTNTVTAVVSRVGKSITTVIADSVKQAQFFPFGRLYRMQRERGTAPPFASRLGSRLCWCGAVSARGGDGCGR